MSLNNVNYRKTQMVQTANEVVRSLSLAKEHLMSEYGVSAGKECQQIDITISRYQNLASKIMNNL